LVVGRTRAFLLFEFKHFAVFSIRTLRQIVQDAIASRAEGLPGTPFDWEICDGKACKRHDELREEAEKKYGLYGERPDADTIMNDFPLAPVENENASRSVDVMLVERIKKESRGRLRCVYGTEAGQEVGTKEGVGEQEAKAGGT
jgi:hypothetical protein